MEDTSFNSVFTNVAVKVVEDTAIGVWEKIRKYFKDLNTQQEINLGIAYDEYLRNTRNRYCKTKTLIYRHVPKDLYSFYECIGINFEGNITSTENVNNILDIGNKIIITGTGGIGKTTLLKHLFLDTIKKTDYIPIMIELRSLNNIDTKEIVISKIIFDNLGNNGFKLEDKFFNYSMDEGGYIIFFDGYDEINKEKAPKITQEIIDFSNKYPDNKYIISSRPTDAFLGWHDFTEVNSLSLTKEQALSLVNKIEFDEKVKKVFYKELDEQLYDKYHSFASNPLLLTIMLLTFDSRASIPDKLNDFYEQAFATLFNMHDATKEAYVRDIRSGLSSEDFKLIFAYVCFKSYFNGEYEFSETSLRNYLAKAKEKFPSINVQIDDFKEDLVQAVCMLVKDGLNYRFSHRSFQEYFAAWYTCKLEDEIQYKLLTNWIKEDTAVDMNSYFTMLYNLQSDKVNKIIFCPGLKVLRKKYEELGFSLDLLKELFEQISVGPIGAEDESLYQLSLYIKDNYICKILSMTANLNETLSNKIRYNYGNKVAITLKRKVKNNIIGMNKILNYIEEEELLEELKWIKVQIDFTMGLLDKYEGSNVGNKRKVSSILQEL